MAKRYLKIIFKTKLSSEKYQMLNLPMHSQVALTKFRKNCHDFEIEKGRQNGVPKEGRLCKLCQLEIRKRVVDQFHIKFECNAFHDL